MNQPPTITVCSGNDAWDLIWRWTWFARDLWKSRFRKDNEETIGALNSLLATLGARAVLDASCGLGRKTIALAEKGYEVQGSDASRYAVTQATQLAGDEGITIRFFQSLWDELPSRAGREYDCVYNDSFSWIGERQGLESAATGAYCVLRPGGVLVFDGTEVNEWSPSPDRDALIERQLKEEGLFDALPPYEKDGVRLVVIICREKTPDGILGHRLHIIEERGEVRIEVASVMDLLKWTWRDYEAALAAAGFRRFYSVRVQDTNGPHALNLAVK